MAHKTITISEKAYEALAALKKGKESFTDVILRLFKEEKKGTLLDYIEKMEPAEELAGKVEGVHRKRKGTELREVRF